MDDFASTAADAVARLSKGNPGALSVLLRVAKERDAYMALRVFSELSRQNRTGPDIWILYKDQCGEDLDAFVEALVPLAPNLDPAPQSPNPDHTARIRDLTSAAGQAIRRLEELRSDSALAARTNALAQHKLENLAQLLNAAVRRGLGIGIPGR